MEKEVLAFQLGPFSSNQPHSIIQPAFREMIGKRSVAAVSPTDPEILTAHPGQLQSIYSSNVSWV